MADVWGRGCIAIEGSIKFAINQAMWLAGAMPSLNSRSANQLGLSNLTCFRIFAEQNGSYSGGGLSASKADAG
eukprot:3846041-Amphidinium_carterae.1